MIERHDYPVTIHWTGTEIADPSEGRLESSDGLPEVVVTPPPEFGGPAHQWSPEHLFAASVASCFLTTFLAIARQLEARGLEPLGHRSRAPGARRGPTLQHRARHAPAAAGDRRRECPAEGRAAGGEGRRGLPDLALGALRDHRRARDPTRGRGPPRRRLARQPLRALRIASSRLSEGLGLPSRSVKQITANPRPVADP